MHGLLSASTTPRRPWRRLRSGSAGKRPSPISASAISRRGSPAARADGRITDEISDAEWFKEALRRAETKPHDRDRLGPYQYGYLDDPVEALDWTAEGAGEPQRNPFKDVGRNDPCPCGSGKKFKKCCLGKEAVEGPWMPPGLSGWAPVPLSGFSGSQP